MNKHVRVAFLLLGLGFLTSLGVERVLGGGINSARKGGFSIQTPAQNPQCDFDPVEALEKNAFPVISPQFSDPRVVYADTGAVYLSQWFPEGEKVLLMKDKPDTNRQVIFALDPLTGERSVYGERNYSDSPPLWYPTLDAVVYLDWAYSNLSRGEVEYALFKSLGGEDNDPSPVFSGISAPLLAFAADHDLLFYSKESSQPVVFDGARLRATEITTHLSPDEASGYLSNIQSLYPGRAYQIRPRPGTRQVLLYNQPNVYIASEEAGCAIDLGRVSTPLGEVPVWALDARWSPNGRFLALLATSRYPGQASGRGMGFQSMELIVLDFQSGSMRRISLEPENSTEIHTITDLAWDPESEFLAVLLASEIDENGAEREGLYLVDAGTGSAQFVYDGHDLGGGYWGSQLAWSPEGGFLIANCSTGHLGRLCLFDVSRGNSGIGLAHSNDNEHPLSSSQIASQAGSGEATGQPFVPPEGIEVTMFRLNGSGARRQPYTYCAEDDTAWGCTAFCSESAFSCPGGNHVFPYPYPTHKITVSVESDYLMDVIPTEMGAWYDPAALASQAVAARTYAFFYQHNPPDSPFNNSIAFQAFIPRKFESQYPFRYPNDDDFQWDDPCDADYGKLNYSQRRVCDAMLEGAEYISYLDESPIRAEFSSDVKGGTITWDKYPYLVGILDPISTACDSNDFGHKRGMSQEGASRWGRGHQCSFNGAPTLEGNLPGIDWSVVWSDRNQILTHYYTGVHLRDEQAQRLTPNFRWNPIAVDLRDSLFSPPILAYSQSYPLDLWVQNTGTSRWAPGITGILLRWMQGDKIIEVVHPISNPTVPGDVLLERINLDTKVLPAPGDYSLVFDFVFFVDGAWVPFSELEQGLPWYLFGPLEIRVVEGIHTIYIPFLER